MLFFPNLIDLYKEQKLNGIFVKFKDNYSQKIYDYIIYKQCK